MRMFKYEVNKLLKYPLMWVLLAVFILFDLFLVSSDVGFDDSRKDIKKMYGIIFETGVNLSGNAKKLSALNDSDNELEAYYATYVEGYSRIYDSLDMQKIKQMKENTFFFHPRGSYKTFIDRNYDRLQKRVEEIKVNGDGAVGFYPGDGFGIHGNLYSVIKLCIIEMLILMHFSVLYLMDFERINRTEDIVFSCTCGRKNILLKLLTGILIGLLYGIMILLASLLAFFAFVPMKDLWNTPVSSFMVMESSGLWEYPFITFVRLTFGQMLALSIFTALCLVLLLGVLSGALQFLIHNSYITVVIMCAGFLALLALPFAVQQANWVKTVVCLNPASLWYTCGRWFMENDLALSFAWSEYWTLGVWTIITVAAAIIGWRSFCRKDVVL